MLNLPASTEPFKDRERFLIVFRQLLARMLHGEKKGTG